MLLFKCTMQICTLFHHSLNFWNIEEIGHMKVNKGELKM